MIEVLKKFLREYLAWAESDAPKDHDYFHRSEGLCMNAYDFALNYPDPKVSGYPHRLEEFLRDQFEARGMNRHFPFGQRSYNLRSRYATLYRCPKRLGWVRAQLEDNDNEEQHTQVRAGA